MKDKLDKRICDCEEDAINKQTYREFIRESEKEFKMDFAELDSMTDSHLEKYFEFMVYLWNK